jgi:hypothetical protein
MMQALGYHKKHGKRAKWDNLDQICTYYVLDHWSSYLWCFIIRHNHTTMPHSRPPPQTHVSCLPVHLQNLNSRHRPLCKYARVFSRPGADGRPTAHNALGTEYFQFGASGSGHHRRNAYHHSLCTAYAIIRNQHTYDVTCTPGQVQQVSSSAKTVSDMDPVFLSFLVLVIGNNVIQLFIWIGKRWMTQKPEPSQPVIQSIHQTETGTEWDVSSDLCGPSKDGLQPSSATDLRSDHESTSSLPSELVDNDLNLPDSAPSTAALLSQSIGANETCINKVTSAVTGYVGHSSL